MAKVPLGSRYKVATADATGRNSNKWTVAFEPADLAIHWTIYEVYKIVVNIATSAGVVPFTVFIDNNQYEGYQSSTIATWSDPQPMAIPGGATLYFFFDENVTDNTPPSVTIWVQIDEAVARLEGSSY